MRDEAVLPPLVRNAPDRLRLPNRRILRTQTLAFGDGKYTVSIGYELGKPEPVEVFADGAKSGSDSEALLDDACILVSLDLQHGLAAEYLLDRVSRHSNGAAASVIGAILGAIVADQQHMAALLAGDAP